MLIEYKDISPVRKQVEVEIPADVLSSEIDHVTGEFARSARIPGFRQGKIPTKVARTRFQKEIQQEVLDRLLPRFFHQAITEKSVEAIGSPGLKSIDPVDEGKPVRFVAEFEVKPPIELRDWKGIEIAEPPVDVNEEDIDSVIERFRDQSATFRTIDDRASQDGDYVVIDVVSSGEGVETRRTEAYPFQLGENAPLPELSESLLQRRAGDHIEIDKTYSEEAPNEDVRGKTIHYSADVKEIRVREVPEVNEDFAKSVGLGENVEEMRNKIREDLKRHREHDALQAKRQQAADKLVEMHEVEVPETLLADELSRSMRSYARFLASQGVNLETASIDWEKVREDMNPDAEKRVKRGLILEAIARAEQIEIADTEVDAEIRRASEGREFADVKRRLREDGGYEALRQTLAEERALERVLAEAKLVRQ